VPHHHHCHRLRNARPREARIERVTQGVEQHPPPGRVGLRRDTGRDQVRAEFLHVGEAFKHCHARPHAVRPTRPQHRGQVVTQPQHRRFLVLRRRRPGVDEWPGSVEVHVAPLQLTQLTPTQPSEQGGQVERPSFARRRQQRRHLRIRQRPRFPHLTSPLFHFCNSRERICRDPPLSLHPVEQGIRVAEVFVEALGREHVSTLGVARRFRPPRHEGVHRHVRRHRPAALTQQTGHETPGVVHVALGPANRLQVRREFVEVMRHELRSTIPESLGCDDLGCFPLLLADEFIELLIGDLSVTHAEVEAEDWVGGVEPVPQPPCGRSLTLAASTTPGTKHIRSHDCDPLWPSFRCSYASTSDRRKRGRDGTK